MAKPRVSSFVPGQLPEFVQTDNPLFERLLKLYYEFMEGDVNNGLYSPIGFLRAALEQKDVDSASELFKFYIRKNLLPNIPAQAFEDPTFIKHIQEFTKVKGTIDSFKFIMQTFFEENVKTTQMAEYVLRSSDNAYVSKTIIVVKNLEGQTHDLLKLLGSSLLQQEPIAAAFVDSISMVSKDGIDYYTCTLRQDSIYGTFTVGGRLSGKFRETEETVIVQVDDILGNIDLAESGSLYRTNQSLRLLGGTGFNGAIEVDQVSAGGVDGAIVVKRGEDHVVGDFISFASLDGYGIDATAEVSHIDGVDANLIPVMEMDTFTIKDGGYEYNVGDLIEIVLSNGHTNPIVKVDTITNNAASVRINYGGNYVYARALFDAAGTYYITTPTLSNGTVTHVPIPGTPLAAVPTLYINGSGSTGSFTVLSNIISGAITVSAAGKNYVQPRLELYSDVGLTTPYVSSNALFNVVLLTNGSYGVNTITGSGYFPVDGTVYFKVVESQGYGFDGDVLMGGSIATASIYRRGHIHSDSGAITSYNLASKFYSQISSNTSAIFDVEYRVKDVLIENYGRGYNSTFTLDAFSTTDTLFVVTRAGGTFVTDNNVKAGSLVVGTGIPAETYVANVDSETQLTLTKAATATGSGLTFTFGGTFATITGGKGAGAILLPQIVDGAVDQVTITNGGTGYNASPDTTINVYSTNGSGAVLIPTVAGGIITGVTIVNPGQNYTNSDLVVVEGAGVNADLSIVTANGAIKGITLVTGGANYDAAATATITGDGTLATCSLVVTDGKITSTTMTAIGSGYTTASVDIVDVGTSATISITTAPNGEVGSVDVVRAGYGYEDPTEVTPLTIDVDPPTFPGLVAGGAGYTVAGVVIAGDGTLATATANISGGKIISVTMTNFGGGYSYADISFSGDGSGAHAIARIQNGRVVDINVVSGKLAQLKPTIVGGTIEAVEIIDAGYGYIVSPTITVTGGGGSSATLTSATVDVNTRKLTGFTLNSGSGYKYGTRIVVDGDGSGAALTPVINTGITKLDIIESGELYSHPKALIYEGSNATADVEVKSALVEKFVTKFIGRSGIGSFLVGDKIFVGADVANATKRGVVVEVEGTGADPIIHYYLFDAFPIHFTSEDVIKNERDPGTSCIAGVGSGAVLTFAVANGKVTLIAVVSEGINYNLDTILEIANSDGRGAKFKVNIDPTNNNKIVSVDVLDGGTGYYEVDTYVLQLHSNTNLYSSVKRTTVSGKVSNYTIVDSGNGYRTPSTIIYNNPGEAELSVALLADAVNTLTVSKNGVYESGAAPDVVIIGDGVGATGHVTLDSNNRVATAVVDTPGSGYTYAHAYLRDAYGINAVVESFAERPIESVTIDAAGSDYETIFLSVIGDGKEGMLNGVLSGTGTVTTATITGAGSSYTTYPTISVTDKSARGAITKVKVTNKGSGYISLPISIIENNASGSIVIPYSRSIGAIKGFKTSNFGFNYAEVPLLSFPLNFIATEMAYPFKIGELVYLDGFNYPDNDYLQGPHAYVQSYDLDRNLIELSGGTERYALTLSSAKTNFTLKTEQDEIILNEFSNYIGEGSTIVGETSQLRAKVLWQNRSSGSIRHAAIGVFKPEFVSSSGYLSNSDIRLQDSKKYHDYAYKVTTGLGLGDYENVLKTMVHPSGFKMFGDILIEGYGKNIVNLPTTFEGVQSVAAQYILLFSLFASIYVGRYNQHIQSLQFMRVGEIGSKTIQDLTDRIPDLSLYKNRINRGLVYPQQCKTVNMSNPGTLTFTDITDLGIIKKTLRVAKGSRYSPLTTTASVNTGTGSGAILKAIVSNGEVVEIVVLASGKNYDVSDTITITGDGVGADYTIVLDESSYGKVTRSTGSWLADGFNACGRITYDRYSFFIKQDAEFVTTATDLFLQVHPISSLGVVTGTFSNSTYNIDSSTETSFFLLNHGFYTGQEIIITFTTGDLAGLTRLFEVIVLSTSAFKVLINTNLINGGLAVIEKIYGHEALPS